MRRLIDRSASDQRRPGPKPAHSKASETASTIAA
jgi:hypothetical protein